MDPKPSSSSSSALLPAKMALAAFKSGMAKYGVAHILDSLPSHESFEWTHLSAASPPIALIIGTHGANNVLAFLMKLGDKPREVRYCLKPKDITTSFSTIRTVTQDDVLQFSLKAPFKYTAEGSKGGKRKFSMVIRWYFMARGLITSAFTGDDTDNSKRFADGLRRIDARRLAENGGREEVPNDSRESPTIEDSLEIEEPGSSYSLRSRRQTITGPHHQQTGDERSTTPDDTSTVAGASENDVSDYVKLLQYLSSHRMSYLLQNLPEADEVQFVNQKRIPEARPKKLFIGHHAKTNQEIYAYMRPTKGHHEINFFVETEYGFATTISSEEVTKQRILHPFNKTYPKGSAVDQGDRARLTLIVKWYFIAAELARDIVLKETKAYPDRLRSGLEYIAQRMGDAAVEPPSSTTPEAETDADAEAEAQARAEADTDAVAQHRSSSPPRRPTWSSPAADAAASSLAAREKRPTRHSSNSQEPPRGTKRSAEDAEFEQLRNIMSLEQELTHKINAVDHELEMKDIQRQNFLDKLNEKRQRILNELEEEERMFMQTWEKLNGEVMEKRDGLDAERGDVRMTFKRLALEGVQGVRGCDD